MTGGLASTRAAADRSDREWPRILISDVELSRLLPRLPAEPAAAAAYASARLLIRLHGQPLGIVSTPLPPAGMPPEDLAREVWSQLAPAIRAHLRADDLPAPDDLTAAGLEPDEAPPCLAVRGGVPAPAVSVIVATHDRPELLARCLSALANQSHSDFEVLVVDNAPTSDATSTLFLRNHGSDDRFDYVVEESPGVSRAKNLGASMARFDLLAFTDDDAIPDLGWLSALTRAFASPQVSCVTGLTLPANLDTRAEQLFEDHVGFPSTFAPRLFDLGENRPPEPLFPYTTGQLGAGVNIAVRTSVFSQLGGFDCALGTGTKSRGGEDLALLLDLLQTGHQLAYEPAAIVRHRHRSDMTALRDQVFGYGVGLGAYLARSVAVRPSRLIGMGMHAGRGLSHHASHRQSRNGSYQSQFPAELKRLERLGMLYGPMAYLKARRSQ
jgi:GT2 family glycosyltransferase